jgi:hypothetical protein
MPIGIFRNSKEKQHKREIKNVLNKSKKIDKNNLPDFCYGAENLGLNSQDEKKALEDFVKKWFKHPESYLNVEKISGKKTKIEKIQEAKENCYFFNSFIDDKDTAKFYESKQPFYGKGEKIAFIILSHWNCDFQKYKTGTAAIRNFFLPVATYRYFPAYSTESKFLGGKRYDIVGPNLGLTLKRFWQDILNIQHFAKYLKQELGYERVGIWAYSIGSPRGFLASMFSKNLFDYLIINFLADSFPESLLHGIATEDISKQILNNLTEKEVDFLFSPLSPGKYFKYFNRLPCTRLVQGKYDLVFCEQNNKILVDKIKKNKKVEIEYGKFGHTTQGEIEKVIPIVYRNSRFVLKNSNLKFGII